jgi:hypothetical protein
MTDRRAEADGWVYFIVAVTTGMVKIGYSRNPDGRLKTLSQQAPIKYEILATIPGTMKDERDLHKKFHAKREHGEWFTYDEELYQYIKTIREQYGHSHHNKRKRKVREMPDPFVMTGLD